MQLKPKGITLIEVLVTLVISVIGIVGLSTLQLQTHRAVNDSGNRSQAIWLLEDLTNRIHLNAAAAANYDGDHTNICNSAPTRVCSPYHNGNSVIAAVDCSGSDMAAWDLYELMCDMNSTVTGSIITKSLPSTFLPNPELTVSVDNTNNNETTLTLKWDSRTEAEKSDNTKVYITDENLIGSNNSPSSYKASMTTVFIP